MPSPHPGSEKYINWRAASKLVKELGWGRWVPVTSGDYPMAVRRASQLRTGKVSGVDPTAFEWQARRGSNGDRQVWGRWIPPEQRNTQN